MLLQEEEVFGVVEEAEGFLQTAEEGGLVFVTTIHTHFTQSHVDALLYIEV